MDDIDIAMLNAWDHLSPLQQRLRIATVRADQKSLLLRSSTRPLRPSCLCIRASDTRLDLRASVPDDLASAEQPHSVIIYSETLHALCKPVIIDWPGLDWTRAAARLGRTPEAIRGWIRGGVFRTRYDPPRTLGKRGKPVPMVWSPSPLDPAANSAAGPDPHWGTLWQWLWQRVPPDAAITLRRIPISRPYPGRAGRPRHSRHRGWAFLCPRCRTATPRLFLPVPMFTFAHFFELLPRQTPDPNPRCTPRTSAAGTNSVIDAFDDPPLAHLDLACHDCHRIRYTSLMDRNGWNMFISAASSGLLAGHEVAKPTSLSVRRKRRYVPHDRPAPRRDQILSLLLHTHTEIRPLRQLRPKRRLIAARVIHRPLQAREIAAQLGIKTATVNSHVKLIYRIHGVHSRADLRAKLRPDPHHRSRAPRQHAG